jgi:hypothetical protein
MEQSINWLEILSIVSSLVSVILGGFAIWLAVRFYEMSSKSAEKLEQASNNIEATTKRLETLFDKLYSDTFEMVKDTVSDMRKHVWRAEDTTQDISDDKLEKLKKELSEEFSKNVTESPHKKEIEEISEKVKYLIDKAVDKSANISKDAFRTQVVCAIQELGHLGRKVTFKDIASYLDSEDLDVVSALFHLREIEMVKWGSFKGKGKVGLSGADSITLTPRENS